MRAEEAPVTDPVLLIEKADGIATLTLNRPRAMNALSRALRSALGEAFRELAQDAEVGAVVLTGAGRASRRSPWTPRCRSHGASARGRGPAGSRTRPRLRASPAPTSRASRARSCSARARARGRTRPRSLSGRCDAQRRRPHPDPRPKKAQCDAGRPGCGGVPRRSAGHQIRLRARPHHQDGVSVQRGRCPPDSHTARPRPANGKHSAPLRIRAITFVSVISPITRSFAPQRGHSLKAQ